MMCTRGRAAEEDGHCTQMQMPLDNYINCKDNTALLSNIVPSEFAAEQNLNVFNIPCKLLVSWVPVGGPWATALPFLGPIFETL
jgi:hypothetical protein